MNTIITGFYKKNWITLQELPEDRRIKTIHLTETDKEYAEKIIPQIRRAELEAMEKLTEEQRDRFAGRNSYLQRCLPRSYAAWREADTRSRVKCSFFISIVRLQYNIIIVI